MTESGVPVLVTERLMLTIPGAQAAPARVRFNRENVQHLFDRDAGAGGPVLGYLNFSEVVRGAFLACYMGYGLAEGAQGRGYMTEACRAGIEYIFTRVRLHRIMANYMPQNHRSSAVLRRLGFTVEGTARAYLFLAGAWQDHVLTSLTNPEPVEP